MKQSNVFVSKQLKTPTSCYLTSAILFIVVDLRASVFQFLLALALRPFTASAGAGTLYATHELGLSPSIIQGELNWFF